MACCLTSLFKNGCQMCCVFVHSVVDFVGILLHEFILTKSLEYPGWFSRSDVMFH